MGSAKQQAGAEIISIHLAAFLGGFCCHTWLCPVPASRTEREGGDGQREAGGNKGREREGERKRERERERETRTCPLDRMRSMTKVR